MLGVSSKAALAADRASSGFGLAFGSPRAAALELELIQPHMAQKYMLWGEVGAHVRVIRACGQRRERRRPKRY